MRDRGRLWLGLIALLAAVLSGCGAHHTTGHTGTLSGVRVSALPAQARQTLDLIDHGGPFPYDRDGIVFENREGLLPGEKYGYYHEYTVPTPGESDRGARRIITGSAREYYWTDDHYRSFERIIR